MEQIGWDGMPQPAAQRPHIDNDHWPEILDPVSDVYCGETFLGPLGLHRFYMGKWISGILYLLTGGLFLIGWIYDFWTLNEQISEGNQAR